jgi:hypothetical protein
MVRNSSKAVQNPRERWGGRQGGLLEVKRKSAKEQKKITKK